MKMINEMKSVARSELERMAKANKGCITPADVVAAASKPSSPLHGYFEWDDEIAGDKYRLLQARALIRSVKVVVNTETTRVEAVGFVRDPSRESSDAGYISVASIKKRDDVKRDVLLAEFSRAAAAIKRARALASVFGLSHEVDDFLERMDVIRNRVINAPSNTVPN